LIAKFQFCSDNFEVSKLPIVKVKKVNIADTYRYVHRRKLQKASLALIPWIMLGCLVNQGAEPSATRIQKDLQTRLAFLATALL